MMQEDERIHPDPNIDLVVREMIPRAAEHGLADAVDAFCEGIAFSPGQVARVFDAARSLGLPVKLQWIPVFPPPDPEAFPNNPSKVPAKMRYIWEDTQRFADAYLAVPQADGLEGLRYTAFMAPSNARRRRPEVSG